MCPKSLLCIAPSSQQSGKIPTHKRHQELEGLKQPRIPLINSAVKSIKAEESEYVIYFVVVDRKPLHQFIKGHNQPHLQLKMSRRCRVVKKTATAKGAFANSKVDFNT